MYYIDWAGSPKFSGARSVTPSSNPGYAPASKRPIGTRLNSWGFVHVRTKVTDHFELNVEIKIVSSSMHFNERMQGNVMNN